ncbi:MAG: efflux RND transporter periplasmic adaptor subunit [Roseiarcus sp.]
MGQSHYRVSGSGARQVYARATGYIDKRNVDIGDRVKAGNLLAQLAVPELDDQISQNEATLSQLKSALEQAEASQKLAQVTWSRDEPLVNKGWVTQQQGTVDVQTVKSRDAAVAVAQQNVAAQESLVKQLRQNRDYASVVAPFDGVITQRNVDVGALVQGNATSGTFMFEIMQEDVIRVWVYVPQDAAFGVSPGIDALVRVPELPDREFQGAVTRIADALQPGTRTLLTEIDIPNPDGALKPGIYCSIELRIPRKSPSLSVPSDAIIFNRNGMQVAVVSDGKAEIRRVRVKRDLGKRVEVDAGIKAGDQVILNPPVNLADGAKVTTTELPRVLVPTKPVRERVDYDEPRLDAADDGDEPTPDGGCRYQPDLAFMCGHHSVAAASGLGGRPAGSAVECRRRCSSSTSSSADASESQE